MAPIVENYFLKKLAYLKSKLPIDRVLPIIIAKNGLMTIEEIAHDACVSFRQLERQFHQRVGVSPKFFLRLIRFANAWMLKEHKPTASWAYIAYHCGYFDQMHLIKDFKEFAGVSPSLIETELIQSAHFQKTGLEFPSV
jgi:transcriptional regulator GlxA family with amidase domain